MGAASDMIYAAFTPHVNANLRLTRRMRFRRGYGRLSLREKNMRPVTAIVIVLAGAFSALVLPWWLALILTLGALGWAGRKPKGARPGAGAEGRTSDQDKKQYRAACQPLTAAELARFERSYLVWMRYTNAAGIESTRRVAVAGATNDYAYGHCLEAGDQRQFRWDRMAELVELQTGEILTPGAPETLGRIEDVRRGPIFAALRPLRPALNVLAYVARRDGAMRKPERAIIVAFAQQDSAACAALAAEVLDAEIKKLPPIEVGEMRYHLKALADRPEAWRADLCALCVRLAQSDKVLHDAERNTLADIHRRLGVEVPKGFVGNRKSSEQLSQ
ncbi:hypothetical protein GCM10011497_06810 [Elstera cyanobacteriorum]|nr:hypothetical protein GCM10011497_06810 [Elstera cyanobacteriorum]